MTFDTNDSRRLAAELTPPKAVPRTTTRRVREKKVEAERIDSDLRVAIEHVTARLGKAEREVEIIRRPRPPETTPREAKVAFGIGLAILAGLAAIPAVSFLTRVPASRGTIAAATTAAPVSRPVATLTPSSAPAATTETPPAGEDKNVVEPPMPAAALAVLRGYFGLLYEASHLPPSVQPGRIDPSEVYFPRGSLDDVPAEVTKNLQLAQLRVARQPVLALRVVGEARSSYAYAFELEVVSATPRGDEVVSRGRIDMVPVDETMRVTKLDALEPFEATGLEITPSTFEQATAPRDVAPAAPPIPGKPPEPGQTLPPAATLPQESGVVATYPYIIR